MNALCKSDGCKADVAFKQADRRVGRGQSGPLPQQFGNTTRSYSKFCSKHTCDFFFEPEGCNFKKPHYDAVCASHALCPITGCTECKGQYLDPNFDSSVGVKYLRYPYCPAHRCSVPQCLSRRAQVHQAGPYLPFCPQHRCAVESCVKRRLDQRSFCQNHKCADEECQTVVEDNYELCSIHIACEVRSCSKARYKLPQGKEILTKDLPIYGIEEYGDDKIRYQYLPYCLEHGTCETESCTGFGTPTSRHCPKHTCPERDCKSSTANHRYCDAHRCESLACENPKGWKKNLKDREKTCPLHCCRKKDCQGDVLDVHFFCTKHECSKQGCVFETIAETVCLNHFKSQYQNDGKAKAKAEMEEWVKLASRSDSFQSSDALELPIPILRPQ